MDLKGDGKGVHTRKQYIEITVNPKGSKNLAIFLEKFWSQTTNPASFLP